MKTRLLGDMDINLESRHSDQTIYIPVVSMLLYAHAAAGPEYE